MDWGLPLFRPVAMASSILHDPAEDMSKLHTSRQSNQIGVPHILGQINGGLILKAKLMRSSLNAPVARAGTAFLTSDSKAWKRVVRDAEKSSPARASNAYWRSAWSWREAGRRPPTSRLPAASVLGNPSRMQINQMFTTTGTAARAATCAATCCAMGV